MPQAVQTQAALKDLISASLQEEASRTSSRKCSAEAADAHAATAAASNGDSTRLETQSRTVSYADRECTVNIDMYTALLGGSIIVQTPEGDKLKLKIKPGTQPGAKVRLKGKGDMHSDGTRGNLILTYNVQLPASLSERQKELLQQMRMG